MNVTGAIRSASILQMLKHGRAGVPMEVMGLMLGEFVDDYTVRVIDVFAMPQSGTVSTATIHGSFFKMFLYLSWFDLCMKESKSAWLLSDIKCLTIGYLYSYKANL